MYLGWEERWRTYRDSRSRLTLYRHFPLMRAPERSPQIPFRLAAERGNPLAREAGKLVNKAFNSWYACLIEHHPAPSVTLVFRG